MTEPLPEGYVVHLPPPAKAPPHRFGDPVSVPADPLYSRHPQTERTCLACGAVKVTVHGPENQHWREWRLTADGAQFVTGLDVPCRPQSPASPSGEAA